MAEWMACPGCQLRHSRRPDGLCPRCKQPVDAAFSEPTPDSIPAPAPTPDAAPVSPSAARLGHLAQSARGKELKNARGIMLLVGGLSILVNGYVFGAAESNVQDEIDKEIRKLQAGFVVDQAKVAVVKAQAVRATRLIAAGGLLLGLVFCICAALVEKHPVPTTIAALALYLGGNAIFALINPPSLLAGIIVKGLIVLGLFKAVQAAVAYQKELATAAGT